MSLEDLLARLSCSDANRILDGEQEDLPVPDVTCPCMAQDRSDHLLHVRRLDDTLDLELRPEVDRQSRTAVLLGNPLLPARALHLRDREAREAGVEQLLPDRLE